MVALSDAHGQRFESESKQSGSSKMGIVLKEVERRPRASVVEIKVNSVGSSVGSSFFILCSIRRLAQLRGPYRYIVKLEEQPKRNQMLVGFLSGPAEPPASAGPEFSRAQREAVIDLEQFAPICDGIKQDLVLGATDRLLSRLEQKSPASTHFLCYRPLKLIEFDCWAFLRSLNLGPLQPTHSHEPIDPRKKKIH